jgi:hypothetical protein
MKKIILTLAVCFSAFSSAHANELNIVVTKDLCDAYKQSQDVNYKEGVDVNGNVVVPADLPSSSAVTLPDVVEIPLTIDLAQQLNLSVSGMELKPELGKIKITKDGKVTFNDKDITNDAQTLCSGVVSNNSMAAPIDISAPPIAPMAENVPAAPTSPVPATVSPSVTTNQ